MEGEGGDMKAIQFLLGICSFPVRMIADHLAWRAFAGSGPFCSFNLRSSDATSLVRFFVVAPAPFVHNMPLIAFT